jgi:hypothetical protein
MIEKQMRNTSVCNQLVNGQIKTHEQYSIPVDKKEVEVCHNPPDLVTYNYNSVDVPVQCKYAKNKMKTKSCVITYLQYPTTQDSQSYCPPLHLLKKNNA